MMDENVSSLKSSELNGVQQKGEVALSSNEKKIVSFLTGPQCPNSCVQFVGDITERVNAHQALPENAYWKIIDALKSLQYWLDQKLDDVFESLVTYQAQFIPDMIKPRSNKGRRLLQTV